MFVADVDVVGASPGKLSRARGCLELRFVLASVVVYTKRTLLPVQSKESASTRRYESVVGSAADQPLPSLLRGSGRVAGGELPLVEPGSNDRDAVSQSIHSIRRGDRNHLSLECTAYWS